MENTARQVQQITEDQVFLPLASVFESVAPQALTTPKRRAKITTSVRESLEQIFPEQEITDKNVKRTKEILGELSENFTDSELADLVAQVQYLAESWLDDFEKDIFDGLTLRQLLHERSGK